MTYRPQSKANRAGTRGFRAPEVLLKCSEQTGGIHFKLLHLTLKTYDFVSNRHLVFGSNSSVILDKEVSDI